MFLCLKVMAELLCSSGHNKKVVNQTSSEKTFVKTKMFGAIIKIMWKEQPVDPPIFYLTSVIAL